MDPRRENGSSPTYVNVRYMSAAAFPATPLSPRFNGRLNANQVLNVCEVLYDYEATGDDELSLRRGQRIELLSTDANISGDEGWWTGRIGDKGTPGWLRTSSSVTDVSPRMTLIVGAIHLSYICLLQLAFFLQTFVASWMPLPMARATRPCWITSTCKQRPK